MGSRACLAIFLALPLAAQSYVTNFDPVKFDQAKGAATFHDVFKVDGATGRISGQIPLGPGIGARGARYQPSLSFRWGSTYILSSALLDTVSGITSVAGSYTDTGTTLHPGHFDLVLDDGYGAKFGAVSNWELPDGRTGVLAGTLPAVPATANDAGLWTVLNDFGLGSGLALWQGVAAGSGARVALPKAMMGSNGELVIFLCNAGNTLGNLLTYNPLAPDGGKPYFSFYYPDRAVVVQGDVAYEFVHGAGMDAILPLDYTKLTYPAPNTSPEPHVYESMAPRYHLNRILNRGGDSVTFTYASNGTSYQAAWSGSAAQVTVTRTGSGLTVVYGGTGNDPSFTVAATRLQFGTDNGGLDDFWTNLKLASIQDDFTQETLSFSYGSQMLDQPGVYQSFTTLDAINLPNRSISFSWQIQPYVRNSNVRDWNGFWPSAFYAWSCGVTSVTDRDLIQGGSRVTRHQRTLPLLRTTTYSGSSSPTFCFDTTTWQTTAFNDVVTYPDQSVGVTMYTQPPATADGYGRYGGPSASLDDQKQALRFIKNVVTEERRYEPGAYTASDLAQPAESSAAYRITRHAGTWLLNRLGNPGGDLLQGSLPYPSLTETFSRQGQQILKHSEQINTGSFDAANFEWKQRWPSDEVDANGGSTASQKVSRTLDRTWEFDGTKWFPPRPTSERVTTTGDSTGSLLAGTGLPFGAPASTWSYTVFNKVQTQGTGQAGDPENRLMTLGYGASGFSRLLIQSLSVMGAGDTLTPAVGISQYGYDGSGFMNLIQQKGVTWTSQQGNDAFGRPVSQTDPNLVKVVYSWDKAGRLKRIDPQDGSEPTVITYDDASHRHVTVDRNAQHHEYYFNGYGELVREVRASADGYAYRVAGYDAMGREVRRTLWANGSGNDSGTGLAATATTYDGQGRVSQTVDPNGVTTTRSYPDVRTNVTTLKNATVTSQAGAGATVKDLTTTEVRDAAGRLQSVQDPRGRTTTYAYDPMNRLRQSTQVDAATGVTQTRTWTYDFLGRLVGLDQPESGTTYTTDIDLLGKPHTTAFGLPRGYALGDPNIRNGGALSQPGVKVITAGFDALGRALSVSGPGVSQSFAYDQQAAGDRGSGVFGKSNGKRIYAQDQGVEQWFYYRTALPGGELDELDTRVWSGGALNAGTGWTFSQAFTYDTYGKRRTSSVDGRRTRLAYDDARGLPTGAYYLNAALNGGAEQSVASLTYTQDGWDALGISGNGYLTQFTYDNQVRPHTLTHGNGGGTLTLTYSFDAAGRMLGTGEDAYQLDELDRIVQAQVAFLNGLGTVVQQVGYDDFGNVVSNQAWTTGQAPALPSSFNNFTLNGGERASLAQTNRIPGSASGIATGATYDPQGNLVTVLKHTQSTGQQQVNLGYDGLGRVVQVDDVAQGTTEVYRYTADGLRTWVQQWQGGSLQRTRVNLYNDARQLVSTYVQTGSGSPAWGRDVVYAGARELAEIDGAGQHVTQTDHLGSPRYLLNGSGAIVGQQKYMPFGEMIDQSGSYAAIKGFTNHESTDASGLIYMQSRFYVPGFHKYASPDPAQDQHPLDSQSWNLYSYVRNNAGMLSDPTGTQQSSQAPLTDPASLEHNEGPVLPSQGEKLIIEETKKSQTATDPQNQGNARTRKFSSDKGAVSVEDGKKAYQEAVAYLRKSPTMKKVVDKFEGGSTQVVFIGDGNDRVEGGKLYWDPHSALATTDGGKQTPALGLGHEMAHDTGWFTLIRSLIPNSQYDNREERRVILEIETPAARELHEGTRTNHDGTPYWVQSPTQF